MGVRLLRRANGRMTPAEPALTGLKSLNVAFDLISEAVSRLRDGSEWQTLTARVSPSFLANWLVPRLYRFKETHASIEIRLNASSSPVDFAHKDFDIEIAYGHVGSYPGLHVDVLFAQEVFPVCSPELLRGPNALQTPNDLRHHTLLHEDWNTDEGIWPDWSMWLEAARIMGIDASRSPRFPQQNLATQAAAQGHGVALGSPVLVDDDLLTGRLVRPFDLALKTDLGICLICPIEAIDEPKVAAFRDWLLAEVSG